MPKKGTTSNATKKEREYWIPPMDDALIDAFLQQHKMGNRVNGVFTSTAYENILTELRDKIDKPLDKEKLKNRIKTIKSNFSACYDLFKNGLSGFSWSPITHLWDAEPEVWEKLIEAKPEAREWMKKPMTNYYKLVELYGKDRATGEHADTASELGERQANLGGGNFMETVDDIDHQITQNEVTLESFTTTGDDNDHTSESRPRAPSQATSSSRNNKRKKSKDDEVMEFVSGALHDVAAALREGNSVYQNSMSRLSISEEEVLNLVDSIPIDPSLNARAYLYLIRNPDMLKALISYPTTRRKELLLAMISDPSVPPSA